LGKGLELGTNSGGNAVISSKREPGSRKTGMADKTLKKEKGGGLPLVKVGKKKPGWAGMANSNERCVPNGFEGRKRGGSV